MPIPQVPDLLILLGRVNLWNYRFTEILDVLCEKAQGFKVVCLHVSDNFYLGKIDTILENELDIVLAACPFCELQIDEGLREVKKMLENPDEVLDKLKSKSDKPAVIGRAITPQSLIMMLFKSLPDEVNLL